MVHLTVLPAWQRHGIGRLLHDVLIAGRPAPTAVLSCHPAAVPTQRAYLSTGWAVLTDDFRTAEGQLGYWLMGRDL